MGSGLLQVGGNGFLGPTLEGGGAGPAVGSCGAWAAEQYDFIHPLMPALTGYEYIKLGQIPNGLVATIPSAGDGAVEGGGITPSNGSFIILTRSVFQTAKTGQCAFAFRARFLAASAGQTNYFGILNAPTTHDLIIGALSSVSTTNYGLLIDGPTSDDADFGVPNDLGFHNFVVTLDAVNIKVYMDGNTTPVATLPIGTLLVDEPMYIGFGNTIAGEAVPIFCMYAYITP